MEILDWDSIELWIDTIFFDDSTAPNLPVIVGIDAPDVDMIPPLYAKVDVVSISGVDDVSIGETAHQSLLIPEKPKDEQQPIQETQKEVTATVAPTISSTMKPASVSRKRKRTNPQADSNRKINQRRHEKKYRERVKYKRYQLEMEWLQLEGNLRRLLAEKAVQCVKTVIGANDLGKQGLEQDKRQVLVNLLQETQAHHQDNAIYRCFETWQQALNMWGATETSTSLSIREQLNSLPSLRQFRTFSFTW